VDEVQPLSTPPLVAIDTTAELVVATLS